jgi:hypothetical protein
MPIQGRSHRLSAPARILVAVFVAATSFVCCGGDPATDPQAVPAAAPTVRVRALAQARAEWPELTIEVVEVSRVDGTLLVRFRFANESGQPFEFGDRFAAGPGDRDTIADVALAEPSGQRKYFVLRDRANRPDCSTGLLPLAPGERRLLFARFRAPRADTSRITIQIPHVPEIADVPVALPGGQNGPGVV